MTEEHKRWVGQVIDGEFQLRQYLGGLESTAVFLINRGERKPQTAAIKLIPADRATADRRLSRWSVAAKISHPHLLRIFESGRCRLDHSDFIYVVMEYAEENLSQIVPLRPLTPAETRDMLIPTLDALADLHAKGFVHGHIKPANIMAVNDQLKLSTDGLSSTRESTSALPRKPSIYNPPEAATGALSPASDVWSLGITLIEVLTQRPPVAESNRQAPPVLPEILLAPFLEIVRRCLVTDPKRRWTIAEIAAHLNPAASTPEPSQWAPSIATASPVTPPRAIPPAAIPPRPSPPHRTRPIAAEPRPQASRHERTSAEARARKGTAGHRYLIPALAVALVLAAILGGARLLNRHETQPASPIAVQSPSPSSPSSKDDPSASRPIRESAQPQAKSTGTRKSSEAGQPSKQSLTQRNPQSAAIPSSIEDKPPRPRAWDAARAVRSDAAAKTSSGAGVPGEVLQQDLPNVSAKARASIQGRVRVSIKVHVDSSGSVTGAEFVSPGPSKYFADLALKSAQKWEFAPAKQNGQYVASDWILRYEFGSSGTKVYPRQIAP